MISSTEIADKEQKQKEEDNLVAFNLHKKNEEKTLLKPSAQATVDDETVSVTNSDVSEESESPKVVLGDSENDKKEEDKGIIFKSLTGAEFSIKKNEHNVLEVSAKVSEDANLNDKFSATLEIFLTVYIEALGYVDNDNPRLPEIRINGGTDEEMLQIFSLLSKHFIEAGLLGKCHLPEQPSKNNQKIYDLYKAANIKEFKGINQHLAKLFDAKHQVSEEKDEVDSKDLVNNITGIYLGTPKDKLNEKSLEGYYRKLNNKEKKTDSSDDQNKLSDDENKFLEESFEKGGIYRKLHQERLSKLGNDFEQLKTSLDELDEKLELIKELEPKPEALNTTVESNKKTLKVGFGS